MNQTGHGTFARSRGVSLVSGTYEGDHLTKAPARQTAGTTREIPSRVGDRLHYRDGRVTDLQGNPWPATSNAQGTEAAP